MVIQLSNNFINLLMLVSNIIIACSFQTRVDANLMCCSKVTVPRDFYTCNNFMKYRMQCIIFFLEECCQMKQRDTCTYLSFSQVDVN